MADVNEKTTGPDVKSAKSSNGSVSSTEVLMYEGKIFTHNEYPRNNHRLLLVVVYASWLCEHLIVPLAAVAIRWGIGRFSPKLIFSFDPTTCDICNHDNFHHGIIRPSAFDSP
jgi:hypothetical protein